MVRIDADDFLNPGLECIKPEEKTDAGETVTITLDDCLACSGCITSAEEIMLQQHNTQEVVNVLKTKKNEDFLFSKIVCSISAQAIASLATDANKDPQTFLREMMVILKNNGVDYVFDNSWSTTVALELNYQFLKNSIDEQSNNREEQGKLPILVSSCPGWVVYAEKTHGSWIVPYLCTVKSPQQILGAKIKKEDPKTYHFSVAPCFDKKLEAARKENTENEVKEVDVVISTQEFKDLLKELESGELGLSCEVSNNNFETFDNQNLDVDVMREFGDMQFLGSDGYSNYVYRRLEKDLGLDHSKITWSKYRKNKDFNETTLTTPTRTFNFAVAYGFKSIQQVIRQMKTNKCKYDFVEVMACPSGCLNGGGQIRLAKGTRDAQLMKLQEVEQFYLKHGLLSWMSGDFERGLNVDSKVHTNFKFRDPEAPEKVKTQAEKTMEMMVLGNNW